MPSTSKNALIPFDTISNGSVYLTTLGEAELIESLLPYLRIIKNAWIDFGLTGVLCVDNIPTVYVREVDAPMSDSELNELHLRFWNQGVAETLIVTDKNTVRIFSGLAKPQKPEAPLTSNAPSLVRTLSRVAFAQQAASFCQATANGSWYIQNAQKYKTDSSVDAYLLDNLVGLHKDLSKPHDDTLRLDSQVANALIGRMLFVCYLVDRGIIFLPKPFSEMKLHEALKAIKDDDTSIDFLYNIFSRLKSDFNGSMFDQDLAKERQLIRPFHMQQIRHFLDGQKVGSPQHNLGFWAYDFKLIPVETISAIYEMFLAHEDPAGKREAGAYYTPRFLAEMTIDVALDGRSNWHTLRYLDPCCGSGIFLVTLFNRIATKWLLDNPACDDYLEKAEALKSILRRNIRGIDLNPTACRLACFSLYIAFLDCLSPTDIDTYVLKTNHKLPYLLADSGQFSGTECIPVIRHADFLETGLTEEPFDCVIGNPPWQGRSSKLIATHIVEKTQHHIATHGNACLLLPSKMFLNAQMNSFQSRWLNSVTVERVIQLADYSFVLFEQALCPAMVVRFRKQVEPDPSHLISYDTPKFQPTARRRGLITIGSQDHKWLSQTYITEAAKIGTAPVIWKRSLWGTSRDLRLLAYLDTLPKLQERVDVLSELRKRNAVRSKPWAIGQGLKPFKISQEKTDRPLVPMPWHLETLFISPKHLKGAIFAFDKTLDNFKEHLKAKKYRDDVLYSSPPTVLFTPPFVLINQGFDDFAFCDFPVVFQDSLQSISGSKEDEDLLLFLTVYLRSELAKYFLFHSSANWGTERDKVHQEELLKLPFPIPEDAPSERAAEIVRKVAQVMRQEKSAQEKLYRECRERHRNLTGVDEDSAKKEWLHRRKERTDALQLKIDPLVNVYFGLHEPEVILLKDTASISIPSSTPSETKADAMDMPTLSSISSAKLRGYEEGLTSYAETLAGTLNLWARERGSDFRVRPSGGVDDEAGVAMVSLHLGREAGPMVEFNISGTLSQWFKRGLEACSRQTITIMSQRELLWFEGESIHIIRPATMVHWTKTVALNDADRIYGEISIARRSADV